MTNVAPRRRDSRPSSANPTRAPTRDRPADMAPPSARLLGLQRQIGNRAVSALVARRPPATVQRVKPGWTGSDVDQTGKAWNAGDHVIDGTKIHRVPVQGLKTGNDKQFASFGDEQELTQEHGDHRAIVLFSEALDPKADPDVMLHFHGWGFRDGTDPHAGWRQHKKFHTVRDVDQDRIEQQMDASKATQTIAILPQGVGKSSFGSIDHNAFVHEVLTIVATMGFPQIPADPKSFRLVLSAHSGGGNYVTSALDYDDKKNRLRDEPSNLREIVVSEAMHGSDGEKIAAWATLHMSRVVEAPIKDRPAALAACPRLRAFYSTGGLYVKKYERLQTALDDWFTKNQAALTPDLEKDLKDRFQVHPLEGAEHETVVRGFGDDPAKGPMANALEAIDHPETSDLIESGTATWNRAGVSSSPPTPPKPKSALAPHPPNVQPQAVQRQASRSQVASRAVQRHPDRRDAGPSTVVQRDRAMPEGAIPATRLGAAGAELGGTAFRQLVYAKEFRRYLDSGREFARGLEELAHVEGIAMSPTAAPDAQALLDAARAQLAIDKENKVPAAVRCASIGIDNAYRDPEDDFSAWKNAYPAAFDRTAEARAALRAGPLSDAAAELIVDDMVNSKASPGFSNHTRGLAIDFKTRQDGVDLGPKHKYGTDPHGGDEKWSHTWFLGWLSVHAIDHHFHPLSTEAWHWDHDPAAVGGPASETGSATPAAAPPAVQPTLQREPNTHGRHRPEPAHARVPLAPDAEVTISWGPNARQDVVAESSLVVLRDVLRAAGLHHATITSTARTAADQARVMYQNLVGHGANQGVEGSRGLYGPAGQQVIDTFVELRDKGLGPAAIKAGMLAKIEELGAENVSHHSADPTKLNVFDVDPGSLGDHDDKKALEAAAKAEVGRRMTRFITSPPDPGEHFEVPPQ